MKILKILLGAVLGLAIVIYAVQMIASESGEVVVLTTESADGEEETRLWVVDREGVQYVRALPRSGWYQRLVAEPAVELERAGVSAAYRAESRLELSADINGLMREKYGWRDVYVEWLVGDRSDSIAVALVPAVKP